ncbi:MAG: hypothetical protein JWQ49_1768 [Edaphobacter sp.]|nr:hypothetical protein [Edaphobacter sp.]
MKSRFGVADFVRRLAGIFIEHFGITQLYDIRPWPASGFSSRLCRGAAGGSAFGAQFPFHLMDSSAARGAITIPRAPAQKSRAAKVWLSGLRW